MCFRSSHSTGICSGLLSSLFWSVASFLNGLGRSTLQPKQHPQAKRHRTKRGRRVAIVIAAVSVLTIAYLAWKYAWPLLRLDQSHVGLLSLYDFSRIPLTSAA